MTNGQVVLITGANGGLGNAVTRAFLSSGATVVGVARSIRQSEFASDRFVAIPADLTDPKAMQAVVNDLARIDVAVHLMGGFAGGALVDETDDAAFNRMIDMNLRSAFYLLRSVVPPMRKAGYGRILAIGSRMAVDAQANAGAYSASKAALIALVKTAALENKKFGITANIILPGTIDTPANRTAMPAADSTQWVLPEQIASLLLYLGSRSAAQVTGAVIPVYGQGL